MTENGCQQITWYVESCPIKGNLSRQLINCLMILKPAWLVELKPPSRKVLRTKGHHGKSVLQVLPGAGIRNLESRRWHAHHKCLMATHALHCDCNCNCMRNCLWICIWIRILAWHSTALRKLELPAIGTDVRNRIEITPCALRVC